MAEVVTTGLSSSGHHLCRQGRAVRLCEMTPTAMSWHRASLWRRGHLSTHRAGCAAVTTYGR